MYNLVVHVVVSGVEVFVQNGFCELYNIRVGVHLHLLEVVRELVVLYNLVLQAEVSVSVPSLKLHLFSLEDKFDYFEASKGHVRHHCLRKHGYNIHKIVRVGSHYS